MGQSTQHVAYKKELFADFFPACLPLIEKHWSEIAHYQDIPLEVDADRYRALEEAGILRIYTARLDGVVLVGYAVMMVNSDAHHKSSRCAVQDALYVHPDFRKQGIGLKLIRFVETVLLGEGVQAVQQHVHVEHPQLGTILRKRGYEVVDFVYLKRLDKPSN
jgi:GNAT superfamily N-acetyltransferase